MRYRAAEKLEIIRLVEQSPLPVRRTLAQLGISRATFYRWYQRYRVRGAVALADGQPAPRRVWNKLPDSVAAAVIDLALKEPEWSPRELATAFVGQQQYFVSEASVYRLLKARALITSPGLHPAQGRRSLCPAHHRDWPVPRFARDHLQSPELIFCPSRGGEARLVTTEP